MSSTTCRAPRASVWPRRPCLRPLPPREDFIVPSTAVRNLALPPELTPVPPDVAETAVKIRAFELKLLDLFKEGLLFGTVHTCVGQEFCAAALHPHLREGVDAFFATHRGHGPYLAHGG